MKTKTSHSPNSSKGFSGTFSIYALVKNVGKTIRTLQNPSLSPKNTDLKTEELESNPSNPSGCEKKPTRAKGYGCSGCGNRIYQATAPFTHEHKKVIHWQCEGCGAVFEIIGGTNGPQLINQLRRKQKCESYLNG